MLRNLILSLKDILGETTATSETDGSSFKKIDFDFLFTEMVHKKFERDITIDMEFVWSVYSKAFDYIKISNFDLADYYYKQAEKKLERITLLPEANKYLMIYITPNKAYYHYKKQQYQLAAKLTEEAIMQIEEIEIEFPNMHMGKIQQLHNISRIYLKEEDYDKALAVAGSLLKYLMLKDQELFNKANWHSELVDRCDNELVSLMTHQIFSETVGNLISIREIDSFDTFKSYFLPLIDFKPSFNQDYVYINWINAIYDYHQCDIAGFLKNARLVFKADAGGNDILETYIIIKYLELINDELRISIPRVDIKSTVQDLLKCD